jgi:hypothetical protein
MKTNKQVVRLLRAIKAASPYSSRNYQWEVGMNYHLADRYAWDDKLGGFNDPTSWGHGIRDVKVGTTVDCYIYRNAGCVAHPDWDLTTNYVITVTSPTTATIRATGEAARTFVLSA